MPRYWGERLAALVFIALSIYVAVPALDFPAGGGSFPLFAAGGIVFLSIMLIVDGIFRRRPDAGHPVDFSVSYARLKPALMTAIAIAYVLLIFRLGYFAASVLFLFASTLMVGVRNIRMIALTALILFPLMYVFFEIFLEANLPRGFLI
jgi:putative tricarboxylic transport membrane protein